MEALESELSKQQVVNEDLSTELREAGSYSDLNRNISDLSAQLETCKRSEQQAMAKVAELEEDLNDLKNLEEVVMKCTEKT